VSAVTIVLGQIVWGPLVEARDFPSAVWNGGLAFRTTQSATVEGEFGYLSRLPAEAYSGAGPVVEAALGLGGPTLGLGGMGMFGCLHALGCQAVSLVAEGYRPCLLSDWEREIAFGGRLTYALYIVRVSLAMYVPGSKHDGYRYMVGAGAQFPY